MNYIIEITEGLYFGGWDALFGNVKTVDDKNLAYRMRRPIADRTLPKLIENYDDAKIIKLAA